MFPSLCRCFGLCKSAGESGNPVKTFIQAGIRRLGSCFDRFFAFVQSRREKTSTAVPEMPPPPVPGPEERVQIGCNYTRQPLWKIVLGVPLIYLPLIMTIPFMIPSIWTVKTHQKW